MRTLLIIKICLLLSSCSMLLSKRRFIDEMERNEGFFTAGEDFKVTNGDDGYAGRSMEQVYARTPSSSTDRRDFNQRASIMHELTTLESKQSGHMARHYEMFREQLPSVSEKIYFLRMGTLGERETYLRSRGVISDANSSDRHMISAAIHNRDIIVGMSKDDVISSWGRPSRVDVAGDPRYENERWSFYERGQLKQVFFESGRVQGWVIE